MKQKGEGAARLWCKWTSWQVWLVIVLSTVFFWQTGSVLSLDASGLVRGISRVWAASGGMTSADNPGSNLQKISEFEGGILYMAGKFRVLELHGSYRQMGRQYGGLLSEEIRGMHRAVAEQYGKYGIVNPEGSLEAVSEKLFSLYPRRFQEMAEGIMETAGIDRQALATLNGFFEYLLIYSGHQGDSNHCAAITAWGAYTGGQPLVMGRNFDFPAFFREFDPYITVVVYNPDGGAYPSAVITYPGQMGSIQAFNNQGLILENNDGSSCGDRNRYFGERTPFMIQDLALVMDHGTLKSLEAALLSQRLHYPLIFHLADATAAYNYEMATSATERREGGKEGLLIGTNHFLNSLWPEDFRWSATMAGRIEDSSLRYRNLQLLADTYKGRLDGAAMRRILDVPVDEGGATPRDRSIYQFVAIPEQGRIWLKAAAYEEWQEIHLQALYRESLVN